MAEHPSDYARLLVLLTVVVWAAFDVAVLCLWGTEATISTVVSRWAREYPAVPLAAGMLIGHWFL